MQGTLPDIARKDGYVLEMISLQVRHQLGLLRHTLEQEFFKWCKQVYKHQKLK
jgi:hypothetical protein